MHQFEQLLGAKRSFGGRAFVDSERLLRPVAGPLSFRANRPAAGLSEALCSREIRLAPVERLGDPLQRRRGLDLAEETVERRHCRRSSQPKRISPRSTAFATASGPLG